MAAKRIVFTGGSGKAGRHAIAHLQGKGHKILNVDLKPLDLPGVNTLHRRSHRHRPGVQRADLAFRFRRL